MSEINEKQKPTNDNYRKGYDRIFGKKSAKDFQKGNRIHIDAQGRKHDNENFESFAMMCRADQIDQNNRDYGHLGAKWVLKDGMGACIIKNCAAQRKLFEAHNMILKNDTQGGPGSARKHLIKTGKATAQDFEEPKRPPPPPRRKGDMSREDATTIIERAKRGMKLTG